jgi:hypothetical protein
MLREALQNLLSSAEVQTPTQLQIVQPPLATIPAIHRTVSHVFGLPKEPITASKTVSPKQHRCWFGSGLKKISDGVVNEKPVASTSPFWKVRLSGLGRLRYLANVLYREA